MTNEESELAFLKGLRTGKITITSDDSNDNCGLVTSGGGGNRTLQNFMNERERANQIRPSSPISPKSYDNTKEERLSFVEEVVGGPGCSRG